jgi:hypothetical protein
MMPELLAILKYMPSAPGGHRKTSRLSLGQNAARAKRLFPLCVRKPRLDQSSDDAIGIGAIF